MNKLSYQQVLFLVLAIVSVSVSAICLWATHHFIVNQTQSEYFTRYKFLSRLLGSNLGQLEKSTESLMYSAVQNLRLVDAMKPGLSNEELKLLAAKYNVTHIFVVDSNGNFIRSTNEDPSLIPNLFSFCDKHRQLLSGDATSFITPIIPPKTEPHSYKFVIIPSADRKRILDVAVKAEFINHTLAAASREDSALEELTLLAPEGTSLGSISKNPPVYRNVRADLTNLKWDEPIIADNGLTIYSRISSPQVTCCQCDEAGLSRGGEYYYVLKTVTSLGPLQARLKEIFKFFASVQLILLIACVLISHLIALRLVSKINQLTGMVRSIARTKDVSQRVPALSGPKELVELSTSFNDLLSNLQNAHRQLVEAKKDQAEIAVIRQVAHDIRAPLSALQIVSSKLSYLPTETSILLSKACERIQRIAEDLIQRQRGFHAPGKSFPALLAAPINDAIEEAQLRYPSLSIEFTRDEDSFLCFAHFDPVSFKRILSNLIDNSVQAAGKGAKIKVTLERRPQMVCVVVDDNGKGFDPNIIRAIGKRCVSDKTGGQGLGLSSACALIRSWSGDLVIENLVPVGARITITLPLAHDMGQLSSYFQADHAPPA